MLSQIPKLVLKRGLNNLSYHRNIIWSIEKNGILSIGINSIYRNIVNNVNVTSKIYLSFQEEIINIEMSNVVYPLYTPFDCKIIKENNYILKDLKDKNNSSELWIVQLEPIKIKDPFSLDLRNSSYEDYIEELIHYN